MNEYSGKKSSYEATMFEEAIKDFNCLVKTTRARYAKPSAVISIQYDSGGEPYGVRLSDYGEDFVIALYDAFEKDVRCDEWGEIEKKGVTTFNYRRKLILDEHIKEVNQKLVEAGGNSMEGHEYFMASETNSMFTHSPMPGSSYLVFNGSDGGCFSCDDDESYRIRFVALV